MGKVLEMICGQATAPGAAITALAMGAGNTNVVRSFEAGKEARLITLWADNQVAGIVRAMSPRMANNNQGIHIDSIIGNLDPLIPISLGQALYPQDTLALGISGSAVAGDFEGAGFLIYYPDLPGASGNFISPDEVISRCSNIMSNRTAIVAGAGGGYTGQMALNATENMFKANKEYALLGFNCSAQCTAVRMIASDLGNIGLGGPGNIANRKLMGEWFMEISRLTGTHLVPVINSSNVGGIIVDAMQDENAAAVNVAWIFAELD